MWQVLDKSRDTETQRRSFESAILAGVFILCTVWSIASVRVGWYNRLSDLHGFRQTQTALTTYYLLKGSPLLRYETPVLGAPWSVPFEFPLYQWCAAGLTSLFHTPLEPTGRFTSELFFLSSLFVLWSVLAEFHIERRHRFVFLSLVLVSPLYLFWSRTFMIESTALFFSMLYVLLVLRYLRSHTLKHAVLAAAAGILGILVKVTTFPAFAFVAGVVYVINVYRKFGFAFLKNLRRHVLPLSLFFLLPLAAVFLWTSYADHVKAQNVVGVGLTSSALRDFDFGHLSDRSLPNWRDYLSTTFRNTFGNRWIILIPVLAFGFVPRRRLHVFVCGVAFAIPFLLFAPLHLVHDYYAYANGIFLAVAVSWCIVALLESAPLLNIVGLVAFCLCIFTAINGYYSGYYRVQASDNRTYPALGAMLQRVTQPNEVIVGLGLGWTSEVPYYSERRALMWQTSDSSGLDDALIRLTGTPVGALVACFEAKENTTIVPGLARKYTLSLDSETKDPVCSIYSAHTWDFRGSRSARER